MDKTHLLSRLLDVIQHDVVPKTRQGVAAGNKIFGAAILRKSDLSLVIAETNNETKNPLWHGEVHAITKLYERDRSTVPDPKDCIFLATHEPCSLCLSAITWAGYDNFYYLFSHEDSRDKFAIPHDIKILREIFTVGSTRPGDAECAERPLYNRDNAFWSSHNIVKMIEGLEPISRVALLARVDELVKVYGEISNLYQASKGNKAIPLA